MSELELYKFVSDEMLEYNHHENRGEKDVILFVPFYQLEDFNKLLGEGITEESGIECTMKHNYLYFWMKGICDYFDIDVHNVFTAD